MNTTAFKVKIDLSVTSAGELLVDIELHNCAERAFENWALEFDFPKDFKAGENTILLSQVGSHANVKASDTPVLKTGERVFLQLRGEPNIIRRLTDFPCGLYISCNGEYFDAVLDEPNLDDLRSHSSALEVAEATVAIKAKNHSPKPVAALGYAEKHCSVIPRPMKITAHNGFFQWAEPMSYAFTERAERALTHLIRNLPEKVLEPAENPLEAKMSFSIDKRLKEEAYKLSIREEKIEIVAGSSAGFFYAVISLLQEIKSADEFDSKLNCQEIVDQPRFSYRGFMLDCARHFHPKATVLRVLDHMAECKLNRFHWHLTDDEGWRIQIKAFPELTNIGAWRGAEEVLQPQFCSGHSRYGGFYTQEEIREVVEYARQRHIVVIPEIDIPGHSRAAIKSLPHLLLEPEDRSVYRSVQMYNDNVLNPGLPGTYTFLHAVLDEVVELFPGAYVHVGADEVPEGVWKESPACKALMVKEGYHDAIDLQGHLLCHIQEYLKTKQRQLMGWEEASNGDKLDHSAIIYAWAARESAARIAKAGYRVIACPAPFNYLDMAWDNSVEEPGFHWAGTADLAASYSYEPLAQEVGALQEEQILGVQALIWSELVSTQDRLEYMLFPRLLAVAETAWSAKEAKNWSDFEQRAQQQLVVLERQGVNHRSI